MVLRERVGAAAPRPLRRKEPATRRRRPGSGRRRQLRRVPPTDRPPSASYEPGWPSVSFEPTRVEEVDPGADHHGCSADCELIQVADLVVSAVAAAIRGPSGQKAKRRIARTAAEWVRESRYGNWTPRLALRRKFGASVFVPGVDHPWPEPVPLAIDPGGGEDQLSFGLQTLRALTRSD